MLETHGVIRLPNRPVQVLVAAGLLLGSAAMLALTWAFGVDAVESNGARVFFVVVWSYLAWTIYGGGGWARWAIIAIFVATVWGGLNAASWQRAVDDITLGEAVAKALALVALGLTLHPAAREWFALVRRLLAGAENTETAPRARR